MDNYVVSIFGFVNMYFARDGFVLLFYHDDFHVLRNIKSYLEDYSFKIHSKFVIINGMHYRNLEFLTKKVNLFLNSTKASHVCMSSCTNIFLSQTFMNRALLLVHKKGSFAFSMNL